MTVDQASQQQQFTDKNVRQFRMRPMEVLDAEIIGAWYREIEDISIFDRQIPVPISQAEVVALVESLVADQEKEKCRWFITETIDGTAVGMSALEAINLLHGGAILPVFIAEPWRRSGLGIRMAAMMIDLAFKQFRLHRVSTIYRRDNAATASLVDRLGFKQEGISRQSWFSHGEYFDIVNVAVLVDEWEQKRLELRAQLSSSVSLELGSGSSDIWCWPGRN